MTTETSIYEYARHGLELSSDKTALWFYGKSITYRELFHKIDNVADHLYVLGVREGTVVTIHLPNCPQAVVAIYAVAKLGGICNMVHAQTPAAALRENLTFTESDILITYLPDCTGVAKTALYVDISRHMGLLYRVGFRLKSKDRRPKAIHSFEEFERPCPEKAVCPDPETLAQKCAVYFHSSGTTGMPKTVMHCHAALNRSTVNVRETYRLNDIRCEVILGVLPMFHGSGFTMDSHLGISGGAQIVQVLRWNCDFAVRLIKKRKVTNITGVPQIFSTLLRNTRFTGVTLHQCFVGGDIVKAKIKDEFQSRTGIPLFEGFGLTETVSTCCGDLFKDGKMVHMLPFSGCTISILHSDNVPNRFGVGELIISSGTVMLGYLKDSESTKNALIARDGKVWIRTGDLGEIDEKGQIRYIDRIKRIIIYNGYNIYPQEVESVIATLSVVQDVCVVGSYDDQKQTQVICACIVLTADIDKTQAEFDINMVCKKLLPHYATPRRLYFVDQLPRNDMNKINLEKLKELLREAR